MATHVLAIDVGTQFLKASIIDADLIPIDTAQVPYTPEAKSKSRVDIDAEILWQAFLKACGQLKQASDAEAISLSTLCPSLLAMDPAGKPPTPVILHLDRRSYRQAMWALRQLGDGTFLQNTGNLPVSGGISFTSILWIRDNWPEIYAHEGVVFGRAVTFFLTRLVGQFVMDPANASFTGRHDTVGYGDWDEGILDSLGMARKKLPRIVMSETVCGGLEHKIAHTAGLRAGIPVVAGRARPTPASNRNVSRISGSYRPEKPP